MMGFAISDFWDATIKEFCIIVDGYKDRKQQESENMMIQAYMISRWVWAKKLNINDVLKKARQKEDKKMSDMQMMKLCMYLNKIFGGKEVKGNGN